jgi:L-alanine-DL-glutamate epimerase-like enolase superfamily enzyme
MAVAAPNTLIFEVKPIPSPMQHELVTNPIDQVDGWISPPDGPGLGVDVDESVVASYAFSEADLD